MSIISGVSIKSQITDNSLVMLLIEKYDSLINWY